VTSLVTRVALQLYLAVSDPIPRWLEAGWLRPLRHLLRVFIDQHQAAGLGLVIFAEELGIPLPVPGDVAISYGGYLTTTGAIPYVQAYLAVVGGAVIGSLGLFTLNRRFGRPFLHRFGRYVGLTEARLNRAEAAFRRWGPWAVILGRHIPGMRIYMSAFAGISGMPYRLFVPCVAVSATIWAAIFLELGRHLGPRVRFLFRLVPAHLLPWLLGALLLLALVYFAYERGFRAARERRPADRAPAKAP